jgi:hypothetical protein
MPRVSSRSASVFVKHELSSGGAIHLEEAAIGGRIDGPPRIHSRDVDLIAHDAVRAGLPSGGEGGRVDAGDRGKHGMAVRVPHAFGAQPVQGGSVAGGDGVGPQPIHDEDDDETRGHRVDRSREGTLMREHSIQKAGSPARKLWAGNRATIARDYRRRTSW